MVTRNTVRNSLPQDTGWSWVVCVAGFVIMLEAGLGIHSLAILFLELVEEFQTSVTVTSLAMTLNILSVSVAALVSTNLLVPRFTVRPVIMVFGFVSAACTAAFSVVPNVGLFIAIAAVQGFALGAFAIPAMTLVGHYFTKRRSLATSFTNTGICVASIIAPPIIRTILDHFALRGTFLILTAVQLHVIPAGMLMRPVSAYSSVTRTHTAVTEILEDESLLNDDVSEKCIPHKVNRESQLCPQGVQKILDNQDPNVVELQLTDNEQKLTSDHQIVALENEDLTEDGDTCGPDSHVLVKEIVRTHNVSDKGASEELMRLKEEYQNGCQELSENGTANACDMTKVKNLGHKRPGHRDTHHSSMISIAISLGTAIPGLQGQTEDMVSTQSRTRNCLCELLYRLFDPSLFRSWAFRVYLMTSVPSSTIIYMQQYIPTIGRSLGASQDQTTTLLTILGAVDLVSRIVAGLVADTKRLKPSQITAITQICLGLVCYFNPLFRTYQSMLVMAVLIGLFIGTTPSLNILVSIEVVGMEKMAHSVGMLTTTSTLAGAAHGPLLSALMEVTGSFTAVLYYVGSAIIVSGVAFLFLPLVGRLDKRLARKHKSENAVPS